MIEATLTSWLSGLSAPLYPLAIPEDKNAPGIVYRIESEFTPEDGNAPYGAYGYRIRLSIWHPSYKGASEVAGEVRAALNAAHQGYLISVEDRGDYQDADTTLYGIVLDVEITELQQVTETGQQGLRKIIKDLLISKTAATNNVFATRIGFANCDQFPCIGIKLSETDIETGNSDQKRDTRIELDIKTSSSVTSENELEALIGQIEAVLHPDIKPTNDSRVDLTGINSRYSSIGRLHYEHRVMTFNVEYYTAYQDSDDLHPFLTANAEWNIDQDADPEAIDTLTLPQD